MSHHYLHRDAASSLEKDELHPPLQGIRCLLLHFSEFPGFPPRSSRYPGGAESLVTPARARCRK